MCVGGGVGRGASFFRNKRKYFEFYCQETRAAMMG